jgi:hypothetical protein
MYSQMNLSFIPMCFSVTLREAYVCNVSICLMLLCDGVGGVKQYFLQE